MTKQSQYLDKQKTSWPTLLLAISIAAAVFAAIYQMSGGAA